MPVADVKGLLIKLLKVMLPDAGEVRTLLVTLEMRLAEPVADGVWLIVEELRVKLTDVDAIWVLMVMLVPRVVVFEVLVAKELTIKLVETEL